MAFTDFKTPVERKIGEALHAASIYFKMPITRERVMAQSKKKEHVRPRQWCMAYLRWKYPETSLPRLARMFNKSDHTTIMHGIKSARKRYPDAIFVTGISIEMEVKMDAIGLTGGADAA